MSESKERGMTRRIFLLVVIFFACEIAAAAGFLSIAAESWWRLIPLTVAVTGLAAGATALVLDERNPRTSEPS